MAAQIIVFRSKPSATPPVARTRVVTGPGPTLKRNQQHTFRSPAKVLSMSQYTRTRQFQESVSQAQTMLTKVESEMVDGYVEVEAEGLSLTRLACIYIAGAREAKDRMLQGVRTLFRFNPAH